MSERDDDQAYGTTEITAPVTRADFERAVRNLHMSDLDLRDSLFQLAARVVTLTDELVRRLDGVEPQPAPPNTPAEPLAGTLEDAVGQRIDHALRQIRAVDAGSGQRVSLDTTGEDKYAADNAGPDCAALIAICEARCCKLSFALSTQDLDEGVIRWDYGQPYLIRQRASDAYCVHNDPTSHFCTVHEHRPRVCRRYDCSKDTRIWIDFANKIPAPTPKEGTREHEPKGGSGFDLLERARKRAVAVHIETTSIANSFADPGPQRGPRPPRRP